MRIILKNGFWCFVEKKFIWKPEIFLTCFKYFWICLKIIFIFNVFIFNHYTCFYNYFLKNSIQKTSKNNIKKLKMLFENEKTISSYQTCFLVVFLSLENKKLFSKTTVKQTLRLLLCFVLFGFSEALCPFQIRRDG